ncbi:hypothetical protein KY285_010386 [Solanum tuberosum]|nr:hypothetical protein KY289_010933 [Solanum tuberosum]KAH0734679.1 hypothetical protein KY285_010386 [Solanum tuberosum]
MISKILFWNIRSVKSQNSFERLLDLNRKHHYSYIALLEPFQSPSELDRYKRKLGKQHAKVNFSSKIWLFWDEKWVEQDCIDTVQQLTISFKHRDTNAHVKVTVVYARCSALERLELWEDLEEIAYNTFCPWMVEGDFNTIIDVSEKLGGLPVSQTEVEDFVQYINSCALSEIKFSGSCYTWWNGRIEQDCTFKRLDRVFGNTELMNQLQNTKVQHLIREGSDHAPLHVTCSTSQEQIFKPFRFLNFWIKHHSFQKTVEDIWKLEAIGSPFIVVQTKMKRVKIALVQRSKTTFGNIFQHVATLEDIVKTKEVQVEINASEENRTTLKKAEADLKKYLHIEEEYWKQKAEIRWFQDGDKNTKFFHAYVNGRRRKLQISEIKTRQGDTVTTTHHTPHIILGKRQ